jgi:hypothetical protein
MVLKYGMIESSVTGLQAQLNLRSPTRLPRLTPDTLFDPLTMARVMEYQHHVHLTADGVVGPRTEGSLKAHRVHGAVPPPAGRCVVVDLINDRLRAYDSGALILEFMQVKGGSATDPSTRGVFKVYKRLRNHTSSKFPIPPGNMDFSLFYNRAEALHQGPPTIPSHGCIHVRPSQASQLFNWAGHHDLMVIVMKLTR